MAKATDYLADVSKTDLMRVVVALATEVYEMRDRMKALELLLTGSGHDLTALDAPVEPAAYDKQRSRERDEFIGRVFAAMQAH